MTDIQRDAHNPCPNRRPARLVLFALLAVLFAGCGGGDPQYVAADQVRPTYSPNHPGGESGGAHYDPNANVMPSPVAPGANVGDAQGVPVDMGFDADMTSLEAEYERMTSGVDTNQMNAIPFMQTLSRNVMAFVQEQELHQQPRIRQAMEDMQRHGQELKATLPAAEQSLHLKQTAVGVAAVLAAVQAEAHPDLSAQVRAVQQSAERISSSQPIAQQRQSVQGFFRGSLDAMRAMDQAHTEAGTAAQNGQRATGSGQGQGSQGNSQRATTSIQDTTRNN